MTLLILAISLFLFLASFSYFLNFISSKLKLNISIGTTIITFIKFLYGLNSLVVNIFDFKTINTSWFRSNKLLIKSLGFFLIF